MRAARDPLKSVAVPSPRLIGPPRRLHPCRFPPYPAAPVLPRRTRPIPPHESHPAAWMAHSSRLGVWMDHSCGRGHPRYGRGHPRYGRGHPPKRSRAAPMRSPG